MVSLSQVKESNLRASTVLPSGLVAVFAGATSGIGEMALRSFAEHAGQPKIYFTGRSQEAGDRISRELKAINSEGTYVFVKADMSLLKNADQVCKDIKSKEKAINVLFMSQGSINMSETEEGLRVANAVSFYSRMRLAANLLPLVQNATSIRRVVNVMAGGKEGAVSADDLAGKKVSMAGSRGYLCSMMTMSMEELSCRAPSVSFVHNYPGAVDTNLVRPEDGIGARLFGWGARAYFAATRKFLKPEEVGERHAWLCLSGMYPAKEPGQALEGVPSEAIAAAADGKAGGGFYSVDWDGESAPQKVVDLLAKLRADGLVGKAWAHVEEEFVRITGAASIE